MLGDFQKCPRCDEYGWNGTHKCPPQWDVRPGHYDDDDGYEQLFADSAESAAEKYLDANFANMDYPKSCEISVRRVGESEWQKFIVDVESVPQFHAYLA